MTTMLSRIADSLFWLARYMERAEDTARILDVNYHMMLEESEKFLRLRWDPLLVMAGEEQRFRALYDEANAHTVFEFLAFRQDNPNSIVQCIANARENARTIRDRLSREMWEDINGLYHAVNSFDCRQEIANGPHRFCDLVKFGSHRFHGVADATVPHDEGWQFLRLGCHLERAEMTARLVDVQYQYLLDAPLLSGPPDNHQWMAVLKSVGAYEAYHRKHYSQIEPEHVAEMLILHPQHPRSIRFSVNEVQEGLRALSNSQPGSYSNEAERQTGKLLDRLRYDRIDEIFQHGLHSYLNELLGSCLHIGEHIARSYFYYKAIV
ncbi:MAG: alpha-E domain-containing protein [Acidobacteriota bacterium]|nr:alpha-E domain-containing protein [Acidobacteriota bacterium]